jgi:hypothetical protein
LRGRLAESSRSARDPVADVHRVRVCPCGGADAKESLTFGMLPRTAQPYMVNGVARVRRAAVLI